MKVLSFLSAAFLAGSFLMMSGSIRAADNRDNDNPWGLGTGAEWSAEYPRFHPMIAEAGAGWVRTFPEWVSIQPEPGVFKWEATDKLMKDLRKNNLRTVGTWCYFAKFASADGGTRKGPIKDMQMWRDYVTATVKRYGKDIKYWAVWNEFNGSFYEGDNKVRDYADLVVEASKAAKKVDPTVQIGLSTASTDIGFLDLVIKAGAAGHFDFITVHPYENLDAMDYGDEAGFLNITKSLRKMLADAKQNPDMPLWITEIGAQAPVKADEKADRHQAEMLAKAYLLSLAQEFHRIYWFEIRGPAYGEGTDFGIIREDWTKRPSFDAFQTMTSLLGPKPKYLGWVNLGDGGHGFLFSGKSGDVLAAWALPGRTGEITFPSAVKVTDLTGKASSLSAGAKLSLTDEPVYVTNVPAALAAEARANKDKDFPWDGQYADAAQIRCVFGKPNTDEGLTQVFLRPDHENRTEPVEVDGGTVRKVVGKDKDNNFAYFRADTGFVPYGTGDLNITVVAKRLAPDQSAKMAVTYETRAGYKEFTKGFEPWEIPAGDGWQEHTWKVNDASFANRWGWHLGLLNLGENGFLVKEVRITKAK